MAFIIIMYQKCFINLSSSGSFKLLLFNIIKLTVEFLNEGEKSLVNIQKHIYNNKQYF